jgi:hypothetical protein
VDRPRVLIAAGVAVLLIVGVIIVSLVYGSREREQAGQQPPPAPTRSGPVALVPVPAPQAGSADCATLLGKLPATLPSGDTVLKRATLADPAPRATAAWTDGTSDPVVLRCGLDKPAELTPTTDKLRSVSGVAWLPEDGTESTTWYLADRTVYVAVTIPSTAGTGVIQSMSEVVSANLAKKP